MPLFARQLDDDTLARVRKDFGCDPYALQAEFDRWLADDASRQPNHYGQAFYGFVRTHMARKPR